MVVLGFPCRPFSRARAGSSNCCDVEQHQEFDLKAHALRFIAKVRPVAAICEHVMGFKPWLEGFCNTLEAEGYHVESRRLPLDVWTDVASARFYMFAVDARRAPRAALASALNLVDAV